VNLPIRILYVATHADDAIRTRAYLAEHAPDLQCSTPMSESNIAGSHVAMHETACMQTSAEATSRASPLACPSARTVLGS
jgi:hypothetical protein